MIARPDFVSSESTERIFDLIEQTLVELGTDRRNGQTVYFKLRHLTRHLYLLGQTRCGKTMIAYRLAKAIMDLPVFFFLLDPKRDLFELCRDYAIANGLDDRLVILDSSDGRRTFAWNSFHRIPNVNPMDQVAAFVDSLLAGCKQNSVDQTMRLTRWLTAFSAGARALEATAVEALDIGRPVSRFRRAALQAMERDRSYRTPFEDLQEFDQWSYREQLGAGESATNRLNKFLSHPAVRDILTQDRRSLDLSRAIAERKIFLVNVQPYDGLGGSQEPVFLARMLLYAVFLHAFSRPREAAVPAFCFVDECHNVASPTFEKMLAEAAGKNFFATLLHQHPSQIEDEITRQGLLNCPWSFILGRIQEDKDAEALGKMAFRRNFDPRDTSNPEYLKETRTKNETTNHAVADGASLAMPRLATQGESEQHATTKAGTKQWSRTHVDAENEQHAHALNHGAGHALVNSTTSTPTEPILFGTVGGDPIVDTSGEIYSSQYGETKLRGRGTASADAATDGGAVTLGATDGKGRVSAKTRGVIPAINHQESHGKSRGTSKTYEPLSVQDFAYVAGKLLSEQQPRQLTLVVAGEAIPFNAATIQKLELSEERVLAGYDRAAERNPHYSTTQEIDVEEVERHERLRQLAPPPKTKKPTGRRR